MASRRKVEPIKIEMERTEVKAFPRTLTEPWTVEVAQDIVHEGGPIDVVDELRAVIDEEILAALRDIKIIPEPTTQNDEQHESEWD